MYKTFLLDKPYAFCVWRKASSFSLVSGSLWL